MVEFLKNADILKIALLFFRHRCSSLLINTEQSVSSVLKYLEHVINNETSNTYAYMFPDNLTDVKNTMNNLILNQIKKDLISSMVYGTKMVKNPL